MSLTELADRVEGLSAPRPRRRASKTKLKPDGYLFERAYAAPCWRWERLWRREHPDPGGATWFIRNIQRCYVKVAAKKPGTMRP